MRTRHLLTLFVVLATAACGGSKSPWARKMTKAERLSWPTKCGIPTDRVSALDGQGDYAKTLYSGQLIEEPPSTRVVACSLSWNRDKDRPAHLRISLGRDEPVLAAEDIEPLLALALAELRPADQEVARRLAVGDRQTERSGGLEIESGFSSEHRRWEIAVRVK